MNILISGAGVAGLCLAIELSRRGFDVTAVEAAPHLRKGGSPIDIRGRALTTARRLGILDDAIAQRVTPGTVAFVDAEDRVIAELPTDTGTDSPDDVELPRDALVGLLRAKVPSSVEFLFSTRITELDERGDGVHVTLSDGSRRDVDLVVGADGLHSNVRSLAFCAETECLKHLGLYIAAFSIDPSAVSPGTRRMYNEPGRMAMIAHYGRQTLGGLVFASPPIDYDYRDRESQRAIACERYGEVKAWKVPMLLDRARSAEDFYFDQVAQIHLPRWSRGRIALIGDAAHSSAFLSGRGTSLAMMGAEFLAEELANADGDHERAFDAYEQRLREYSDTAQTGIEESRAFLIPATHTDLERRNEFYANLSRQDSKPLVPTTAPQTIQVGGATVAYTEHPADDGPGIPLVLVHGGESDRTQFASFAPLLDRRIRVISYDQRDTGDSRFGTTPYTMADLGDDLAGLIQELAPAGAHVLGTSFGGAVALHAALRHPQLVRSLTLVATLPSHAVVEDQTARLSEMSAQERARFMLDAAVSEETRAADPTVLDRVRAALSERPASGQRRRQAALRSHDVADELGSITAPALVIHGTDDPLVPTDAAAAMAEAIPNAHFTLLEDTRHGILFQHEATVASQVSRFIVNGKVD